MDNVLATDTAEPERPRAASSTRRLELAESSPCRQPVCVTPLELLGDRLALGGDRLDELCELLGAEISEGRRPVRHVLVDPMQCGSPVGAEMLSTDEARAGKLGLRGACPHTRYDPYHAIETRR